MNSAYFPRLLACLTITAGVGLTGCASIGRDADRQGVFVRSNPPGATIIVNGKPIGRAPTYAFVSRGRHPRLEVDSAQGPVDLPVMTKYRWGRSFFGNFVFIYAPIGWIVDFATGAAWSIEDPNPIEVKLTTKDAEFVKAASKQNISIAAIAPPQADLLSLSDFGATEVERFLKERSTKNSNGIAVKSFQETLPVFLSEGYDFDGKPTDLRNLNAQLGIRYVYESTIEAQDGGLVIKAQRRDLTAEKLSEPFEIPVRASDELARAYAARKWWSRLLPNAIGVDFITESLTVTAGGKTYPLTTTSSDAWYEQAAKYLSAIDISNIPARRPGRALRGIFDFVPVIRLSRLRVKASGLPLSDGNTEETYSRFRAGGGYGIEGGLQIGRHYIYANVVPLLFWNRLTWNHSGIDREISDTGLQTQVEFGYAAYVTYNWNVRIFTRTQTEDQTAWEEALLSRLPATERTGLGVSDITAGLSIAYRFDPHFRADSPALPVANNAH